LYLRVTVSSFAHVVGSESKQVLGADPDDLERFATHLQGAARQLERIQASLGMQISASTWSGAAAVRFGSAWRNAHQPSLRLVGTTLSHSADQVRAQAVQQRIASSSPASSSLASSSPASSTQLRSADFGRVEGLQSLYQANQVAIAHELHALRAQRAEWLQMPGLGGLLFGIRFLPFDPLEEIDRKVSWLESLEGKHRKFLFVDTIGSGHAAEVFGDIDHAKHVAVVVPGVSTDLSNFARPNRLPAAVLQRGASDTAVVQWLGYSPPANLVLAGLNGGASSQIAAHNGAKDLRKFIASLRTAGAQDITVIGHSLGAYLVSVAAGSAKGLAADRLVFAGSPGSFRSGVEQLRLQGGPGSESTVFVIEHGADPVAASLFGQSLLGSAVYHPEFGATQLLDGEDGVGNPIDNHSSYFRDKVTVKSIQLVISNKH
jgi:uncharacterized protein YukE/pimeloyl-ACP methyl ester carboxylesterase